MRTVGYSYYRSPGSGLAATSPWTGLTREIDRLFDTALTSFGSTRIGNRLTAQAHEDAANTRIRADKIAAS
jgi:hypothetical protein